MQINVIHDHHRTDRKVLLDSEAREHNLDIRIWPAIIDPLKRGFVGISQAHKQIVRYARDMKMPMVCIGEDDLHLTDTGAFEYFIKNIPDDFDLYLSGIYHGKIEQDNTVKEFCALHLYIVHQRFYDCFLGVDELTNLDRGLKNRGRYVVCNPFCAIQHPGWSDNKRRFAQYDHLLANRRLYQNPA